jgi:hypothetical protein
LGTDIDLQTIDNDVVSMEIFFKAWLQNSETDQEDIHLILPSQCFGNTSRANDNPSTQPSEAILHRARGVTQVVEHLPSKCKGQFKPKTAKKERSIT